MRIGLISDTHIPDAAKALPPQVKEAFRDVDLIMHAGDLYEVSVLDELESIAPVLAALGDDDGDDVARDHWLPASEANPSGHVELPDVIVCGHSHFVAVLNSQGVLIVNPGSATFPHYSSELGTVALLTLNGGEVETQIVHLQSMQ